MKIPKISELFIPKLLQEATDLKMQGKLAVSENNLTYLDIEDAYIHQLFPLLKNPDIKKPDYFGQQSAGAHITVFYPEENKKIHTGDLHQKHSFNIKNLIAAEIGPKTYYALLVEAPSLLQLRRKHQLPDLLCFKGYGIGFHITIGYCIRS